MLFCVLFVHLPCPRNSIILNFPPIWIFHFFIKPSGINGRVWRYAQFCLFYAIFEMTSLLFNRCNLHLYFNVTLPQTGTEHQNKNVFDEHVYTWKINTINCIFISTILNFRFRGQQSLPIKQTSKIKMASLVKRPCFALNGQNNYL